VKNGTFGVRSGIGNPESQRRKKKTDQPAESGPLNACEYPITKCENGGCSKTAYADDEGNESRHKRINESKPRRE